MTSSTSVVWRKNQCPRWRVARLQVGTFFQDIEGRIGVVTSVSMSDDWVEVLMCERGGLFAKEMMPADTGVYLLKAEIVLSMEECCDPARTM